MIKISLKGSKNNFNNNINNNIEKNSLVLLIANVGGDITVI